MLGYTNASQRGPIAEQSCQSEQQGGECPGLGCRHKVGSCRETVSGVVGHGRHYWKRRRQDQVVQGKAEFASAWSRVQCAFNTVTIPEQRRGYASCSC